MGSSHPYLPADQPSALPAGLSVLLHAWHRAHDAHADVWEFAVEVTKLCAAGLTTTDLRWLTRKGYVHHAVETTEPTDKQRVFGPHDRAVITEKSAFVLTAAGAKAARRQPQVPFYDRELRELWLANVLVKRFRRPAPLQHIILSSFHELGWPRRIDDPLPKEPGHDPKERLRDTIKRLNQNLRKRLIRFGGGGRGLGLIWELRSHR